MMQVASGGGVRAAALALCLCVPACAPRTRPIAFKSNTRTLEQTDAGLAAALSAVRRNPSPEHHRQLAAAYLSRGVRDAAFDEFSAALRRRPGDAVAYEGRARIWRDWGFYERALGDAYRAVHYAPASPSALNTLATVFHVLGRLDDAVRTYERVLALDPEASYALRNLCSIADEQPQPGRAAALCRRTLTHPMESR
jgi:tetratricopeptide (TPR) repeat protein